MSYAHPTVERYTPLFITLDAATSLDDAIATTAEGLQFGSRRDPCNSPESPIGMAGARSRPRIVEDSSRPEAAEGGGAPWTALQTIISADVRRLWLHAPRCSRPGRPGRTSA